MPTLNRSVLRNEILLLLGVSLGASAIHSVLDIVNSLTQPVPLSQQTIQLNPTFTPGRPYLDLAYHLYDVMALVVPALLAIHLLNRDNGRAFDRIGLDARRPGFDIGTGAGLAAVIGSFGLLLYFLARHLGINANIAPASLGEAWWAVPVLVLLAAANGFLEEVVVVGYLVNRLQDLGWQTYFVVMASALLRGSYHLYQGVGGFVGNAAMGVIFALFFLRYRRVVPLILAHTLLDVGAFVGYTFGKGHIPGL